jgi:hypothetical protein
MATIVHNLQAAKQDLKDIQRQDKANRQKSLHDRLAEAEQEVQDSDDPEDAQKAARPSKPLSDPNTVRNPMTISSGLSKAL